MEDTDWTATGLFSPSKARLAQAQAKDWSFIDAWLTKKYLPSRVPTFERNEETLGALLALISVNEAADERRHVVDSVEKSALQYYTKQKNEPGDAVYKDITDHLYQNGHDSVETLARASLLLNTPIRSGIDELAFAAADLQMRAFETQQAAKSAEEQTTALKAERERLLKLLTHLKSDAYTAPTNIVEDTAQWLKGTKHLRAKIGEYEERLTAARPSPTLLALIEEISSAVREQAAQKAQLVEIHDEVEMLQSFPPQQAVAKKMLAQAQEELRLLSAKRDELLKSRSNK